MRNTLIVFTSDHGLHRIMVILSATVDEQLLDPLTDRRNRVTVDD
jgi:arylsulfatase A-like enzyme